MLSFLLTNAFPKLGIYTSIGILFYKYNLMGTLLGVVIIHMINSMMFMVWLPCSAFQAVHKQQEEAARDVGAGPIRTFFQVSFPMAMPGIMVATLYTFLGSMEEAPGHTAGWPCPHQDDARRDVRHYSGLSRSGRCGVCNFADDPRRSHDPCDEEIYRSRGNCRRFQDEVIERNRKWLNGV